MPEIEFDGSQMIFRDSGSNRPDWSIAITDYELRQVASTLPPEKSLPVALRGDSVGPVLVFVPTGSDMAALVALARMRDARMGPHYPEGVDGAQEADQANAWRITRDYYLSNRQNVVSAVAKGISTASVSTLQETQQIGRQIMERLDALFESRDVAR